MKDICEVYPRIGERFYEEDDYGPLLESFEHEILLQVDDVDYQGDSRLILKDNERYGLLIFGWGSCSGCDALRACESAEDFKDLQNSTYESIKWFSSREDIYNYIKDKDWPLEHSYHADDMKKFLEQAIELLKDKAARQ